MALISTPVLVLLIVLAVLLVAVVVLYIIASKAQKKSDEQRELMEGQSQIMSFYVIDKAKVKLSEAGFPKLVLEQTPKYLRRSKVPILKVKVGQRVMTLMADQEVYNTILPKQEVKAKVSGIYVLSAKRLRGPLPEKKLTKKEKKELAKEEKQKQKEKEAKLQEKALAKNNTSAPKENLGSTAGNKPSKKKNNNSSKKKKKK